MYQRTVVLLSLLTSFISYSAYATPIQITADIECMARVDFSQCEVANLSQSSFSFDGNAVELIVKFSNFQQINLGTNIGVQIGGDYISTSSSDRFFTSLQVGLGDSEGNRISTSIGGGSSGCFDPACQLYLGGNVVDAWEGVSFSSVLLTIDGFFPEQTFDFNLFSGGRFMNFGTQETPSTTTQVPEPSVFLVIFLFFMFLKYLEHNKARQF